jgi:phosphocarrier protein
MLNDQKEMPMPERRVVVATAEGLHARPAAVFVKAAAKAGVPVSVGFPGGARADARSILAVLSLDVRQGDEVVLTAEGSGADEVLDELTTLLSGETVDALPAGEGNG